MLIKGIEVHSDQIHVLTTSSTIFDATVIGVLPEDVCVALDGTDGVTESCSLPVGTGNIMLEVANIDGTVEQR